MLVSLAPYLILGGSRHALFCCHAAAMLAVPDVPIHAWLGANCSGLPSAASQIKMVPMILFHYSSS
jgi:hypothetical protein